MRSLFRFSSLCLASVFCFTLQTPLHAQNYYQGFNADNEATGVPPHTEGGGASSPPQPTDLQVRMNTLENMVRNLTGQVERIQFQNTQLLQNLQRMQGDNDVRFRQLEARAAQHDTTLQQIAAQQAAAQAAAASAAATPAASTPAAAANEHVDEPPTAKKEDGKLGTLSSTDKTQDAAAQAQYDAAFASLRQAKYEEAGKAFQEFLKGHPKHHLAENATYWLAETYYVRGMFQEAAVAFADGYEKFPKGGKAADNLLKLAMSLGSLKKKADACLTLDELTKRFPDAPATTRNRTEAQKKSLGCKAAAAANG